TVNSVPSIVIGDEKGAGKDRRIAKEFIQRSAKTLLNEKVFTDLIVNNEVIFVVSSTGGGTGSGMSPVLTDILSRVYPTKRFILVGILPTIKESIAAQQNTIEYLKEMRNFKATYMLYDNNIKTELPTSDMMKAINNQIVEDICVIRGDYQHATPFNSIDEKDMLKIIETEGRLVLATTFGFKEKDI
ncbi:tubulin-like doman-containing protein, partial [Brevibacillus sp. MCWH]|uniref:tubulin-like doman-containing protein n=1 Tax=Brevibacillus sp. MCWH TaxID=2508871 RepID=UPI001C0F3472